MKTNKITIGSDHAGFELKKKIIKLAQLTNKWLEVAGEENEATYYDI